MSRMQLSRNFSVLLGEKRTILRTYSPRDGLVGGLGLLRLIWVKEVIFICGSGLDILLVTFIIYVSKGDV